MPVVLVVGPRQAGKSTLAELLVSSGIVGTYLTLDDGTTLAAAGSDPYGFVAGLTGSTVIDEIQRVPELLLAIKSSVDRDRAPGRFLLTGSANVMLLPRVSESLAGRMETHTLWPLSQGELDSRPETFVGRIFCDHPMAVELDDSRDLVTRVVRGGFAPVVDRAPGRRDAWFGSYVEAVVQREVRDIANVDRLASLPRLLALLAARTATLLNVAEVSRSAGIPGSTLQRYLTILEHVFLVQRIPAWRANVGKRVVRSPKLHLVDSGLACHLLGAWEDRLSSSPDVLGPLLESFVGMELVKQATWAERTVRVHHFRTAAGREVDFVLEDRSGAVVGVEVKAASTVGASDVAGLRHLADVLGDRFVRGVVLYRGDATVPFGERIAAWPLTSLWS